MQRSWKGQNDKNKRPLGCTDPMDTSTMQSKALGKFSEEGAKKCKILG